jgi:hypothetical protein
LKERQTILFQQQLHCISFREHLARSESKGEPELQLYQLLRQHGGNAYSRYNALLRELLSF